MVSLTPDAQVEDDLMQPEYDKILPQYSRDRRSDVVRRRRRTVMWIVMVFCVLYGFSFALLSQVIIFPFVVPLALLMMLVVWALPDLGKMPGPGMPIFFTAFLIALVLWPNYLAIALPGMPWITMARLTAYPMLWFFILTYSTSKGFRDELKRIHSALPWMWKLNLAFITIQVLSMPFSKEVGNSLQKLAVYVPAWGGMFFVCSYLFTKPGRAEKFAFTLWIMAIILGILALFEFKAGHPLWAGHIPSFLKVEDEGVQTLLSGAASRPGSNVYRVSGTYGQPLGLAEYAALALPFIVHIAFGRYRLWIRLLAVATVPLMFEVVRLCDSRLGMVGCIMTLLLSILSISLRTWRRNKWSMFGPAVTLAYPLIFTCIMGVIIAVPKLRTMVLGGGAQASSTDARFAQYHSGIPKIWAYPFGHGIGEGAYTLGFVSPGGVLTIDTYYLAIALEYGVIGFLVYYGMILYGAGEAALKSNLGPENDRDFGVLSPIAISLLNFFVIKSVFSQQDNHPLVFMMMGIIAALSSRLRDHNLAQGAALVVAQAPKAAGSWGLRPAWRLSKRRA